MVSLTDIINAADPKACTRKYFIMFSTAIPCSHTLIRIKNLSKFNSIPTHTPRRDLAPAANITLRKIKNRKINWGKKITAAGP
jgi:hypothetical protein